MIGITRYKWGVPDIPVWAPPRCNRSCQHLQSAAEDTVGYARRHRVPTAARWQDPALKTILVNWHHQTRGEDHWVPKCLLIRTLQIDLFYRASQFHRCLWQRCICDACVVMFRRMSFHCASDFWRHWQIWKSSSTMSYQWLPEWTQPTRSFQKNTLSFEHLGEEDIFR